MLLDPTGIDIADHERGQNAPSCVSDGDTYWVGFHTSACDSTYSNVYVARIDASGTVIDPDGFPVCTAEGEQRGVKLAWGDGTLLVLWEDDRNFGGTGYDVYGARISSGGTVLNPDGMAIVEFGHSEITPDVGWTGEAFLGIWQAGSTGEEWDISGARIVRGGSWILSPSRSPPAVTPRYPQAPPGAVPPTWRSGRRMEISTEP